MFVRLLILFICVPIIELFLLLQLAEHTSWQMTLVIVVVTGVVGSYLAKRQGFSVMTRIRQQLAESQLPTDALVDALMIFVAGALLLTPGILTDVFGLSLLVPVCRSVYRGWLIRWFQRSFKLKGFAQMRRTVYTEDGGKAEVVDSYVVTNRPDDSEGPEEAREPKGLD